MNNEYMELLIKDSELIKFINEKKNCDEAIDPNKLYYYYSKVVKLAYIKTYIRLNNYKYAKICADIIENIFWLIFQLTLNIKLTMFLSERSIIMFSEYIFLSKDDNITNAKLFVYEKTIGVINISEFKTKKESSVLINRIKHISAHCENINQFYHHILSIENNEDEYNTTSNYFENIINIFNLFPDTKIIYKVLFDILLSINMPILSKINLLFIICHVFYIKNRPFDDLRKLEKYINGYNLKEIDTIYINQVDIEHNETYDYFYNCFY